MHGAYPPRGLEWTLPISHPVWDSNHKPPASESRSLATELPAQRHLLGYLTIRRHPTCEFRKHATSGPAELGRKNHEIEPILRSLRRRGSCTFAEVARLVPSGFLAKEASSARGRTRDRSYMYVYIYIYIYMYI